MMRNEREKTLAERLMKVRLFAGMSREEIAEIVRRVGSDVHRFASGETVFYEGTKSKWVIVVLSGRLTVFEPAASVASEVVFLETAKIRQIWHEHKFEKFFANLYSIVSGEVLASWRKMSILACKKVEDRFMLYLRWYASEVGESDITLPFKSSEDCASYLGVTRTALSLAIKRLVDRGEIVHPGHSRFVICGIV